LFNLAKTSKTNPPRITAGGGTEVFY